MSAATTPFHAVVTRDLVRVRGADAGSFLHALLSQDLDPVTVGGSTLALLLQPQGKLLVDLRLTRTAPDEWWCDCEAGCGATLAAGLERFKVRVEVEIEAEQVSMLAVRGTEEGPPPAAPGRVLPLLRGSWTGYDVLGAGDVVAAAAAGLTIPRGSVDDLERARIEAGVPRQGADVDERTIPQEAGLERDAVSFTKGCFVGQELVCRIDTRGHVNRYLRRLRAQHPVAAGQAVLLDGREVGAVTSAVGEVALAMIRREVGPDTTVTVAAAHGGIKARVEAIFDPST